MRPTTSPRGYWTFAALVLFGFSATAQAQQFNIEVFGSLAPNGFGSTSWSGYANNANIGLQNNQPTVGDPNLPTYYAQTGAITGNQMIVTQFNSWLGQANPGTAFGPAFANELGNRLHFGLHISSATPFSLSQLNFAVTSTVGGGLNLGFAGSFDGTDVYGQPTSQSAFRIGRTAGGQIIDSGPATQLVTDLWYTGVGTGFAVLNSDPGATNQEKIDNFLANNPAALLPFTVTGTYWLTNGAGGTGGDLSLRVGGTVLVNPVPEPGTLLLAGVAAVCFAVGRLRRRVAAA